MNPKKLQAGFTLLELMVVIVIIGILATFASLSVGNRTLEDTLENEARRTEAIVKLAGEEAEAKGVEIGLRFSRSGYRLLTVNNSKKWADYEQSGPLRSRQLSGPVQPELSVEGRKVALPPPDEPEPPVSATGKAAEEDERLFSQKGKPKIEPQVLLLSSGEMTPFVLQLYAPGLKFHYRVEADALGHTSVSRVADSHT